MFAVSRSPQCIARARGTVLARLLSAKPHAVSPGPNLAASDPSLPVPHRNPNGTYANPFHTWRDESLFRGIMSHVLRWRMPVPSQEELDRHIPVLATDVAKLYKPPKGVRATWLGQSSFLLQFGAINALVDPIFTDRLWVFGHRRVRPLPLDPDTLPHIHAVFITHNHGDHLDASVVRRYKNSVQWIIPEGLGTWFANEGVTRTHEMTWWDTMHLYTPDSASALEVTAIPAQHHTQRTMFDKNMTLWCGFVLKGNNRTVMHVGDTGYCDVFRRVGDVVGEINLALLPIGSYEPREFMAPQHANPEDAVDIHVDSGAQLSVGMHWGTYIYSSESLFEPPVRFTEAAKERGVEKQCITIKHGASVEV